MISLVTGGAGFIGSHLVEALLERGERVRVLDNFSTGKWENLSLKSDWLEIVEGDLRDAELIEQVIRGVGVIYHLAADVSVTRSMEDPQTCFDINVQGTINLLDGAKKEAVQRVVVSSSCAVYGDSRTFPLREDGPIHPLSPYAASKRVDEVYAGVYTRAFGVPVVSLRYFNVYGPRQSPDSVYAAAIPIFINAMLNGKSPTVYGDGDQSRDFVYVGDVVRANLLAAESSRSPGYALNICTGRETSILKLIATIKSLIPDAPNHRFGPPRPGDIYRSLGDASLAGQMMGFRAEVPLEEGLIETVKWIGSQN